MARQQWLAISTAIWIFDVSCGHVLDFEELPLQTTRPLSMSGSDSAALLSFVELGIVEM